MRKFITPIYSVILVAFVLTGTLTACQNVKWNPSDEEMCLDFYGLTPGTWQYDYCIDNLGEAYSTPWHE